MISRSEQFFRWLESSQKQCVAALSGITVKTGFFFRYDFSSEPFSECETCCSRDRRDFSRRACQIDCLLLGIYVCEKVKNLATPFNADYDM
jgi:hypothetical protein